MLHFSQILSNDTIMATEAVRNVLLEVVGGYQPASDICDYVWKKHMPRLKLVAK